MEMDITFITSAPGVVAVYDTFEGYLGKITKVADDYGFAYQFFLVDVWTDNIYQGSLDSFEHIEGYVKHFYNADVVGVLKEDMFVQIDQTPADDYVF